VSSYPSVLETASSIVIFSRISTRLLNEEYPSFVMAGAAGKKRAAHEAELTNTGHLQTEKRLKCANGTTAELNHPLLSRIFPRVQTLRAYLISKLPSSSRLRRKKIASLGSDSTTDASPESDVKTQLCHLLDTTLVAFGNDGSGQAADEREARWEKWASFSQNADESHVTLSDGQSNPFYSQSEVSGILFQPAMTLTNQTSSDCRLCDLAPFLPSKAWRHLVEAPSV
jgi:hypothetical protein